MQQYFVSEPLSVGKQYILTKEQAHHAGKVLRMNHETVRLVYEGKGYFADVYPDGKQMVALVEKEDENTHELPVDITLAMALIRKEKMELILLKAAELGVKRVVPFESSRCVVKNIKEKDEKRKVRWQSILQEGSEQCKRDCIPELTDTIPFSSLTDYISDCNLCAYENAYGNAKFMSDTLHGKSITIVIGPEGGFSQEEVSQLQDMGYESITLGSRILRAETAALYALSVTGEWAERENKL